MPKFTTEKNMFTAWWQIVVLVYVLILPFMTTVRGVNFFTTHPFKSY